MSEPRTKVVVIFDGLNLFKMTGARGNSVISVQLKPGRNYVDLSDWHCLKDGKTGSAALKVLMDAGKIKELKVSTPSEEKKAVPTISEFNVADAVSMVKNTLTASELDDVEAEENAGKNRVTVHTAIKEQREIIARQDPENDAS